MPNTINTDNLRSLTEFAKLAGLQPYEVTRLITPQKIKTVELGNHRMIDISKYPPEEFRKKPKS